MLHVQRALAPEDARLLHLLSGPLPDDADHAEALALVRSHPAIDVAKATLQRWADEARSLLGALPDGSARRALESLCDVVVERTG